MFGTDGMRGRVSHYPITAEMAMRFGMAAAIYLKQNDSNHKSRIIIAKDTRLSGYLLESAITAGLLAIGADVILLGPMPTPAVAMLIRSLRASGGIVITASHNPYQDNGFKFFNNKGHKLSEKCEKSIQEMILNNNFDPYFTQTEDLGRATRLEDAAGRYIEYLKNTFPRSMSLSGLRIVIDCANGAAYKIAPMVLWELGAEVITIADAPNGININEGCGVLSAQKLQQKVVDEKANIGIALDGDGDRILVCDENGELVNGDYIIAAIAKYMLDSDMIDKENSGIVVNDTSNQALDDYMNNLKLSVWRTKVGDRHVLEEMYNKKSVLGGEVSGHIIIGDYSTTGDGIMASLYLLAALIRDGLKVSSLSERFVLYPQYKVDIPYGEFNILDDPVVQDWLRVLSKTEDKHRIIVRNSGTEKVIRVTVEGKMQSGVQELGMRICNFLQDIVKKK